MYVTVCLVCSCDGQWFASDESICISWKSWRLALNHISQKATKWTCYLCFDALLHASRNGTWILKIIHFERPRPLFFILPLPLLFFFFVRVDFASSIRCLLCCLSCFACSSFWRRYSSFSSRDMLSIFAFAARFSASLSSSRIFFWVSIHTFSRSALSVIPSCTCG